MRYARALGEREDEARGALLMALKQCAATLYSVDLGGPDHEAVIRFGGKAPRGRAHSVVGMNAMAQVGSPPPRIVIGSPPAGGRCRIQ